jgi:hypothetical protein
MVLLVFLVPIMIGVFLLAMEQLEYELLVRPDPVATESRPASEQIGVSRGSASAPSHSCG